MKDASTSTTYYRVADACCRVATNVMVEREHEKKTQIKNKHAQWPNINGAGAERGSDERKVKLVVG